MDASKLSSEELIVQLRDKSNFGWASVAFIAEALARILADKQLAESHRQCQEVQFSSLAAKRPDDIRGSV